MAARSRRPATATRATAHLDCPEARFGGLTGRHGRFKWRGWLFRTAQREVWALERQHAANFPMRVTDAESPVADELEFRGDVADALSVIRELPERLQRVLLLRVRIPVPGDRRDHGEELPTLVPIEYHGELVALVSPTRIHIISPRLRACPPEDHDLRFVTFLCLCCAEALNGRLPGPYSNDIARTWAERAMRAAGETVGGADG